MYRMDEDAINQEVDELRERLLKNLSSLDSSAKQLKLTDTHGRAAAKKTELDKMARALGTRSDYTEGEAFDRDKQEEYRQQRAIERAERDRRRDEEREKREKEKEKWEAMRKERERLRRRQEDQARQAREEARNKDRDLPPNVPTGPRRREPSPPRYPSRRSQTRSPPPAPTSRRSSPGRFRSPPRHKSTGVTGVNRRSRSPPPYRRGTRSPPPVSRRSRDRSRSRSHSTTRHELRRSRSPRRPPTYAGNGYRRRLSPVRSISRERRSVTPPPPSRRLSSRSPPHRHISPSPPRRRDRSRTPPPRRGTGFGERIVDDRSPTPEESSMNGRSRSPPIKSGKRSVSRGSSGSEMSVSGSEG